MSGNREATPGKGRFMEPTEPSFNEFNEQDQRRADPGADQLSTWQTIKRFLWPILAVLLFTAKFAGKAKLLLLPALKFFPMLLKTGGTMFLSVGLYAINWGWAFAVGFVLLIFVHECGHLVAARMFGLKVGAPVFIPFMGAFIALKEAPRNAWIEACVGIGGPIFGAVASLACVGLFGLTQNPMFLALAYTGFLLNLFNLAPIGMLDGGRIVSALTPWLWVPGIVIAGYLVYTHPNIILFLIVLTALPRLRMLFRKRTEEEQRYFELSPGQRMTMGFAYFGLIAALAVGMQMTFVPME